VALEPGQRFVARRVQHDPPALEEEHAVAGAEHAIGALFGDDHGRACRPRELDRLLRSLRVELGGRLVEQQHARFEREHRGEADALKLTAGELGHRPLRQVRCADRCERLRRSWADPLRRRAEVLEPERHLGGHAREHDLVLRVLEERRNGSREIGGTQAPRVMAGDLDAAGKTAPVEVRHEPGKRAQQRRLPTAGGAEQRDHLAGAELERDVVQRRRGCLRIAEGKVLDPG